MAYFALGVVTTCETFCSAYSAPLQLLSHSPNHLTETPLAVLRQSLVWIGLGRCLQRAWSHSLSAASSLSSRAKSGFSYVEKSHHGTDRACWLPGLAKGGWACSCRTRAHHRVYKSALTLAVAIVHVVLVYSASIHVPSITRSYYCTTSEEIKQKRHRITS